MAAEKLKKVGFSIKQGKGRWSKVRVVLWECESVNMRWMMMIVTHAPWLVNGLMLFVLGGESRCCLLLLTPISYTSATAHPSACNMPWFLLIAFSLYFSNNIETTHLPHSPAINQDASGKMRQIISVALNIFSRQSSRCCRMFHTCQDKTFIANKLSP